MRSPVPRARWAPTRREALRAAAAAGAGVALLGGLPAVGAEAAPRRAAAAPIVLVFRPWYNFPNGTSSTAVQLYQRGIEPWLAQNPGVQVQITTIGYQGATIAALLAGQGPDVFEDYQLPPYLQAGLLLDLTPYIQQDNLDLNVYVKGQLDYIVQSAASTKPGMYALPAYLKTEAWAVNTSLLDDLGLTYPEEGWTYLDWTKLWEKVTLKSSDPSKARWGGQIDFGGYDIHGGSPSPMYLHGFGGGYVDPSDPTKCWLDQPGSIACMEWVYTLVNESVIGGNGSNFAQNQVGSAPLGTDGGLASAVLSWRSVRWRMFPVPLWPKGKVTYAARDFYAISGNTAHPELAWSLLKYLSYEQTWTRFMIKLALWGPNQKSLWPEWLETVEQTVPILRDKNLRVLVQQVQEDTPYVGRVFKYFDNEAAAIIQKYVSLGQQQQMSWPEAMRQAAQQIDALEATGPSVQAAQAAALRNLQASLARVHPSPTAQYPAPPTSGAGVPYHPAPQLVVQGPGGTWTLLGDGQDVWNTSDNCVFACLPVTATEGQWTCRVTSVVNLTCPHLSQWAKVGIMARADLSDDASHVALYVTGAHQIEWQWRGLPGYTPSGTSGLLPAGTQNLMAPNTKPAANYLLAPLWLRIQRVGTQWTPFASLDGVHWTQLAPPALADAGGMWIGIFACSHNGSLGGKGYIRASFDHLSFAPTQLVQLGQNGVPPQAGAVPANWATMAPAGA